jgi:hypothetical protein
MPERHTSIFRDWMVPLLRVSLLTSRNPCEDISHRKTSSSPRQLHHERSARTPYRPKPSYTASPQSIPVNVLSEICNTLGTELLQEVWHGNRPSTQNCISVAKSTASLRKIMVRMAHGDKTLPCTNVIRANKAHVTPVKTTIRPWIGTDTEPKEHGHTTHIKLCVKRPRGLNCHKEPHYSAVSKSKNQQYSSLDNWPVPPQWTAHRQTQLKYITPSHILPYP